MSNPSIIMPDNVKNIIETLESNGYEAFAVGGCVYEVTIFSLNDCKSFSVMKSVIKFVT